MQSGNFFEGLGHLIGAFVGAIVHILSITLNGLGHALSEFTGGLAGGIGMRNSTLNIVLLVVGVLILVGGVRALLRRALISGVVLILIAVFILSRLIMH